MLPRLRSTRNDLGEPLPPDVIPAIGPALGLPTFRNVDLAVWEKVLPHLRHRDNDVHTLYSYGLARVLVDAHPDADPDVVLPAVLLHDSGWSAVPLPRIMAALSPVAWSSSEESFATVRVHEVEGARIAREVLGSLGFDAARVDEICAVVDGHDTRRDPLSLNDALVRDADRLWRITPRGIDVVMDWFGLTREESLRLNAGRVHGHLSTATARAMALALGAVGWADVSPHRVALDGVG
ncbi:HD domain-containing protein [Lentzea sp. NPDC058436]|uniref:HD domain-containing protein n=1 Tax=Lentzea sp. NPDC058436 TaxID=3346499 RepID=UPI003665B548